MSGGDWQQIGGLSGTEVTSDLLGATSPVSCGVPTLPPEECASKLVDMVSVSMSQAEIIEILVRHRCPDITEILDFAHCQSVPNQGGGWGDTYEGRLTDGRPVAIKCTRVFLTARAATTVLKEAAKELYAWSKCCHENVQELLGIALYRNELAMVSPWATEGSVLDYINSHPTVDRLKLCTQIATGLGYLHASKPQIVHGDMKARNVLMHPNGTAMLSDYGSPILKSITLRFTSFDSSSSLLSSSTGTLRWTAPEIMRGSQTSPKSDVYGLGMTILEIITGEPPFAELHSEMAVMVRLLGFPSPPSRPECCIPSTDEGNQLWDLLNSCWTPEPFVRPTAIHVKTILEQLGLNSQELRLGSHNEDLASCAPSCANTRVSDVPTLASKGLAP